MSNRRAFLATLAGAAVAAPSLNAEAFRRLSTAHQGSGNRSAAALADDETYWGEIQRAFDLDRTLINLNNGGCSPAPTHVLDAMIRDLRFSNELPVHHMWNVLEPRIESVRRDLAHEFGCDPEEMAITRNASEAMETLILGIDLKRGDEVIVTDQNYGRMLTTWDQRARRDGIVVKQISFKVPLPVARTLRATQFKSAITPQTRVIEITHIINLTGQILPVREVVEMARPQGIEVFVDGAHAFAHFPFTPRRARTATTTAPACTSGCSRRSARASSTSASRRSRIWPLMAAPTSMDENIRKYEEIGTHPAANHNAIAAALAFHRAIGAERKVARLRYLRDRWAKRLVAESDRFHILDPDRLAVHGGIGLVAVDGIDIPKLSALAVRQAPHREHADRPRRIFGPAHHAERLYDARRGGPVRRQRCSTPCARASPSASGRLRQRLVEHSVHAELGSAPHSGRFRPSSYSVVLPSKCSVSASASARVRCTTPSRWLGGA